MLTNADLRYHYHPQKGWMNDPNGLCEFKGEYHFFYQHSSNFEYPWQEPMEWGHCRTRDFLNYEELPNALSSDKDYDKGGVWSGTAVEKDGMLYLFYASVDTAGKQTISVAYSKDGINFEKYENNPIIRDYPADGSRDFRDPAILVCEYGMFLVVASADVKKGTGNLLLYRGDDFFNWHYVGVLYEYEDRKYCECPSFVPHGDGYILSTSVMKHDETHYFEVMYGDFDGTRFVPEVVSHFQKGPDEYAGQIFHAKDGRNILISWVPGWNYQPKEKCIGCLSLPLELSVKDGVMRAYPIREVRHLLEADDTFTDAYIKETFVRGGEEVYINVVGK